MPLDAWDMEQRRKQGLKWLAGIGVASSPIVGCIVLTVVLLKRRKARRSRADEAANLERDSGIEVCPSSAWCTASCNGYPE